VHPQLSQVLGAIDRGDDSHGLRG
jgi:hypothetical protein